MPFKGETTGDRRKRPRLSGNAVEHKFDSLAASYAECYSHAATILEYEKVRRLQLLLELTRRIRPRSILDAGCGSGVALSALAEQLPEATITGLDFSSSMLAAARKASPKGVSLVRSRVEHPPFAAGQFDLVCALGVIDYLNEPTDFFKAVNRVLCSDGYFIFTYPNAHSVNRLLRDRLRTALVKIVPSRTAVGATPRTRSEMVRWLKRAGFEALQCRHFTFGNGVITWPWSIALSARMERCLKHWNIGRHFAWSCLCVARARRD